MHVLNAHRPSPPGLPLGEGVDTIGLLWAQELKKRQIEQQRKQAAKDIRLSAYTAEADLNVSVAWSIQSSVAQMSCAGQERDCSSPDVAACILTKACPSVCMAFTMRWAVLTRSAAMSVQLKVKKAREFLQKGNRVRVMVAFPGRRGFEDAKRMLATLVEQVYLAGLFRQMSMVWLLSGLRLKKCSCSRWPWSTVRTIVTCQGTSVVPRQRLHVDLVWLQGSALEGAELCMCYDRRWATRRCSLSGHRTTRCQRTSSSSTWRLPRRQRQRRQQRRRHKCQRSRRWSRRAVRRWPRLHREHATALAALRSLREADGIMASVASPNRAMTNAEASVQPWYQCSCEHRVRPAVGYIGARLVCCLKAGRLSDSTSG